MKKQGKQPKKKKPVEEKATGADNSQRGMGKKSKLFHDQTNRNELRGNITGIDFDKAV